MKALVHLTLALLILTAAPACGPTAIYEETHAFPTGWSYADSATFTFTVVDLEPAYDLLIGLDHLTAYPAENIYVRLHTTFPDGRRTSDRISLELAGDYGVWNGDCNAERCDFEVPILEQTKFETPGEYRIVVEQFSRDETIPEVEAVSLRVLESAE